MQKINKSKTIRSIHFFNKHIVLDYGDQQVFELCHSCKHEGRHVKRLLQHFVPELNLGLIQTNEWLMLERRIYRKLWRGEYRSFVNQAVYGLGEFVAHRNGRILKWQQKL